MIQREGTGSGKERKKPISAMKQQTTSVALVAALVSLVVVLQGCGSDEGSGTNSSPIIVSQPSDAAVTEGDSASFSVVASGAAPLSYQWYRDTVAVGGANLSTYTIPVTSLVDNGATFLCQVANSVGSVSSSTATLTVTSPPPVITTQPTDQTTLEGTAAVFDVVATGAAPLTYQWRRSDDAGLTWAIVPGATSATYTTAPAMDTDDGAQFECVVSNAGGNTASGSAALTVTIAIPTITLQPVDQTVHEGETAVFTVVASCPVALTYQWQKNAVDIPGATGPSYTTPPTARIDDGALFRCVVTAISVSINSDPAMLTVLYGTVWSWGPNGSGQLGDGTTTNSSTPVQVLGPGGSGFFTGAEQVVSKRGSVVVCLRDDGTVWAWGKNTYGQLGDGTTTDSSIPVQVLGPGGVGYLTEVQAVSASSVHCIALKTDGTVWTWGYNFAGQLGNGTTTDSLTPVQVKGLGGSGFFTNATAVAVGGSHSIAAKIDGTVWTWGSNLNGQLGAGNIGASSSTPVQVGIEMAGPTYLTGVEAVSAGGTHCMAMETDGTVWLWGGNASGQLGNGTTVNKNTASSMGVGQAISAGHSHSMVLNLGGTIAAWGSNSSGQLGDGTTTERKTPVSVVNEGGVGALTNVQGIAAGLSHSVALMIDGTVRSWGANGIGQLGDGSTTGSLIPVQVVGPGGVGNLTGIKSADASTAIE